MRPRCLRGPSAAGRPMEAGQSPCNAAVRLRPARRYAPASRQAWSAPVAAYEPLPGVRQRRPECLRIRPGTAVPLTSRLISFSSDHEIEQICRHPRPRTGSSIPASEKISCSRTPCRPPGSGGRDGFRSGSSSAGVREPPSGGATPLSGGCGCRMGLTCGFARAGRGLIRRSMEHVRAVRRNPYPQVSVLPDIRHRHALRQPRFLEVAHRQGRVPGQREPVSEKGFLGAIPTADDHDAGGVGPVRRRSEQRTGKAVPAYGLDAGRECQLAVQGPAGLDMPVGQHLQGDAEARVLRNELGGGVGGVSRVQRPQQPGGIGT